MLLQIGDGGGELDGRWTFMFLITQAKETNETDMAPNLAENILFFPGEALRAVLPRTPTRRIPPLPCSVVMFGWGGGARGEK